jgi:hypothetical protein
VLYDLRVAQCAEDHAVEKLDAQTRVETFD